MILQADKHTLVMQLGIPYRDLRVLDPLVMSCLRPQDLESECTIQTLLVKPAMQACFGVLVMLSVILLRKAPSQHAAHVQTFNSSVVLL